jgi:hypothetical protein
VQNSKDVSHEIAVIDAAGGNHSAVLALRAKSVHKR